MRTDVWASAKIVLTMISHLMEHVFIPAMTPLAGTAKLSIHLPMTQIACFGVFSFLCSGCGLVCSFILCVLFGWFGFSHLLAPVVSVFNEQLRKTHLFHHRSFSNS